MITIQGIKLQKAEFETKALFQTYFTYHSIPGIQPMFEMCPGIKSPVFKCFQYLTFSLPIIYLQKCLEKNLGFQNLFDTYDFDFVFSSTQRFPKMAITGNTVLGKCFFQFLVLYKHFDRDLS